MGSLFPTVAVDNTLPQDECAMLANLPAYPTVEEVQIHAVARRLERRGLIKIHRERDDPIAARQTWYAGRL